MAKEQGLIGDPQLPPKDKLNLFRIDNPSVEVLKKVFEFPFPPHEMEIEFKNTGDNTIFLPLAITLDSLYPDVEIGKADYDFDNYNRIKGDSYEQRIATLSQLLKSGLETVTFHVEKFKVKSGQLALTDNEVDTGKGFKTFSSHFLPALIENGYEISSINVDFDGGYTYSTWSEINRDGDLEHAYPHTLKYNERTLQIYRERYGFHGRFVGQEPITETQHETLEKWWGVLRNLAEKEKKESVFEEQLPISPSRPQV